MIFDGFLLFGDWIVEFNYLVNSDGLMVLVFFDGFEWKVLVYLGFNWVYVWLLGVGDVIMV